MTRLIFIFLLLISYNSPAQQWFTYKIPFGIEIDFPKEPTVVDTLSFRMTYADSSTRSNHESEFFQTQL